MQLAQPHVVGVLDDEGVGVGDVETGLDDGGAHQHVVLAVPEALDGLLELLLGHLSVGDDDPGLRDELTQLCGALLDGLDLVVHVEHLAVAQQLAADRRGDLLVLLRADVGEHGVAVLGRGEDRRHLPDPGHRHLQGPRDRGRRHRQHVDVGTQCLDVLLVLHTETLFLVDDDQSEVLPAHAGLEQAVGADDDVGRPVLQPPEDPLRFGAGGEPRQSLDGDGETVHPFGEGRQVLLGEQRRGDEDRDLAAVLDRLERGPDCDLGLAVADIADDDPVHGHGFLHVLLHGIDREHLVLGLDVWEVVLHLPLPGAVRRERVPRGALPLRVELDELTGDLPDGGPGLLLGVLPVRAAHLRQGGFLPADVAGEQVEGVHRDVELVSRPTAPRRRVLDDQVLPAGCAVARGDGPLRHLHETADTVGLVDDEVPGLQRQRVNLVPALGGAPFGAGDVTDTVAGQVGLGDHDQREGRGILQFADLREHQARVTQCLV